MLLFCCLVVSLFCCFVVLLIFYICTVSHFIPLLREERVVVGSSFVSFSIKNVTFSHKFTYFQRFFTEK